MADRYKTNMEYDWGLKFGANLQNILKTRNITQQELARKMNTTDAMMSRYVHGTAIPSVYKACQIANIVGCDINELVKVSCYEE